MLSHFLRRPPITITPHHGGHANHIHQNLRILSSWCYRPRCYRVCRLQGLPTQEREVAGQVHIHLVGEFIFRVHNERPQHAVFLSWVLGTTYILKSLFMQAFDALIHFVFEGSFLWLSVFGRQVNISTGPFAEMCTSNTLPNPRVLLTTHFCLILGREYAAADFRWGVSDPTVVSLELLTVLGAGPLCCYILKQLASDDPARHYWLIVLSTAELYGG